MVICEHCQSSVNVVMRDGAALRCGCGKTQMENPDMSVETKAYGHMLAEQGFAVHFERLLTTMRQHKAYHVKVGDVEVDLSPAAFAPAFVAQDATPPPAPADEQCTCGHPLHDHTQAGCVMGCDIGTCGRAEPS